MDWSTLYFELPIFQEHFGGTVSCAFKKLYVAMSLYEDITNRNEIVAHASEVRIKGRNSMPPPAALAAMSPVQLGMVMLSFDVVHILLQPQMVTSVEHVSHAISRAVTNIINQKIHCMMFTTEVVYMMGGSSDVTKCVNDMCVNLDLTSNFCKGMLTVTISKTKYFGNIASMIKGTQLPITKLMEMTNKEQITKSFKFSKEELALPGGLNGAVLGRIGTKRL